MGAAAPVQQTGIAVFGRLKGGLKTLPYDWYAPRPTEPATINHVTREERQRRGNPPVECGETGSLATDPPRRIHPSFTENPTWKQEIATGLKALAMTWKWGGGRSGPAEWISLRWREG